MKVSKRSLKQESTTSRSLLAIQVSGHTTAIKPGIGGII